MASVNRRMEELEREQRQRARPVVKGQDGAGEGCLL